MANLNQSLKEIKMKTNTHTRITLTNDDTRDITIRIMDHLIEKLQWEPLDEGDPGEWYPFDLQDEIHSIINEALEVKE
jgi:hypothetical protein